MKKVALTIAITFLFTPLMLAQISHGGVPKSFDSQKKNRLRSDVVLLQLPSVNEDSLRAEDLFTDTLPDMPYRFGFNHEVDLNPSNSGQWEDIAGEGRLWRLSVRSENARSINLTFDEYLLPENAALFIYNEDHSIVLGSFTSENNQEHGYFSTTLITGEAVTIEYFEPFDVAFSGRLNLLWVTHGYRGPSDYMKAFRESGSCNVNVACSLADGWENQVASVAMMVTGGDGFCTGALINNTLNDATPYFLTANHCYSNPSSWVFWFNWQSETCTTQSTSPSYNSINGATLKARNSATDFCLVQIGSAIPQSFGAYWSGWNRTTSSSLNETAVGIHHPAGDIKKFSYSTNGLTTTSNNGGSGSTFWRISSWSGGTTTEGGSSGSALFDANKRIIGQLYGGTAACGNTNPDYYGKLGVSWTGGGTNSTRLSNWLDPNDSGVEAIDGYDPFAVVYDVDAKLNSTIVPTTQYLAIEQITPEVEIKNVGTSAITSAKVSYSLDGLINDTVLWTGNLATGQTASVIFTSITPSNGSHTFVATVSVANDLNTANDSFTRNFEVVDCATPINTFPYSEGFESTVLPSCWSQTNTHATNNWTNANVSSLSGTAAQSGSGFYYVRWVAADQDEWLISPKFDFSYLTSPQIAFWFNGNYQWSVTTDNCDLDLMVRVDNSAWVKIWGETDNTAFTNSTTNTWLLSTIDLSDYQGQNNVQFAFRYSGNDGYNFSIDNIVISGAAVPTYSLTVNTIGQGTVNVNNTPYTATVAFAVGASVALSASPANDYQFNGWSGDVTGTANFQTITMNSNKTVTANFTLISNINTTTSEAVLLYPNPANNMLQVSSNTLVDKLEIITIAGQVLFFEHPGTNYIEINTTSLASGLYLVKVYTGNEIVTRKLVVKH